MAAIRKRGKSWRVQIRRRGHPPQFKAFDTRADAEAWARQIESEIDRGAFVSRVEAEKTLIADLLDRYKREITPSKRSSRVEEYTLKRLRIAFGCLPIARLRPQDVAAFRDQRIAQGLAGGTVIKDLNTLSHVIQTARREWGISLPDNPVMRGALTLEECRNLISYGGAIATAFTARFYGETLSGVSISLDPKDFDTVTEALTEAFGKSNATETPIQTQGGLSLVNKEFSWRRGTSTIMARKYAATASRSSITIDLDSSLQEFMKRNAERKKAGASNL